MFKVLASYEYKRIGDRVYKPVKTNENIEKERNILELYIRQAARGERSQQCVIAQSIKLDKLLNEL